MDLDHTCSDCYCNANCATETSVHTEFTISSQTNNYYLWVVCHFCTFWKWYLMVDVDDHEPSKNSPILVFKIIFNGCSFPPFFGGGGGGGGGWKILNEKDHGRVLSQKWDSKHRLQRDQAKAQYRNIAISIKTQKRNCSSPGFQFIIYFCFFLKHHLTSFT